MEDHLKMTLNKVNKTIGLLHKLQKILPRSPMLTIYKTFIRPHLGYAAIIYDQAYNASFHQNGKRKMKNFKFIWKEKLYEELGLDSLQLLRLYRQLSCLYKLFSSESSHFLFKLIPSRSSGYVTRKMHNIPFFRARNRI